MVSFGSHVDFSIPHIKIRNLNKHYAVQGHTVHALKNIDLDIPTGKVFGIIGKSGAGKSSLLRTLKYAQMITPLQQDGIYLSQPLQNSTNPLCFKPNFDTCFMF